MCSPPEEAGDRIGLASQRHLMNNFKLATQLGAEEIKIRSHHVAQAIADVVLQKQITTVWLGKPHFSILQVLFNRNLYNQLLHKLPPETDIIILA